MFKIILNLPWFHILPCFCDYITVVSTICLQKSPFLASKLNRQEVTKMFCFQLNKFWKSTKRNCYVCIQIQINLSKNSNFWIFLLCCFVDFQNLFRRKQKNGVTSWRFNFEAKKPWLLEPNCALHNNVIAKARWYMESG